MLTGLPPRRGERTHRRTVEWLERGYRAKLWRLIFSTKPSRPLGRASSAGEPRYQIADTQISTTNRSIEMLQSSHEMHAHTMPVEGADEAASDRIEPQYLSTHKLVGVLFHGCSARTHLQINSMAASQPPRAHAILFLGHHSRLFHAVCSLISLQAGPPHSPQKPPMFPKISATSRGSTSVTVSSELVCW